jgi:hypothetical protein
MCAYTVIVGDTLPHVLQALIPGIETWPHLGFVARRTFVITFCTVLISFPLSLYRDISKLAKTSAVAMIALVVIIIAVMIEGPRTSMEIRGDPTLVWSFARPELFQSIGVISFGMLERRREDEMQGNTWNTHMTVFRFFDTNSFRLPPQLVLDLWVTSETNCKNNWTLRIIVIALAVRPSSLNDQLFYLFSPPR